MVEMRRFTANEDAEGYLRTNTAFHDLIYRMTGNDRLRVLAAQLILPVFQIRLPQRMNRAAMAISYRDHQAIAAALVAGNEADVGDSRARNAGDVSAVCKRDVKRVAFALLQLTLEELLRSCQRPHSRRIKCRHLPFATERRPSCQA